MLNADQYGVREIALRGAPMSLEDWSARHANHDVKTISPAQHVCYTCWTLAVERVKDAPPAEDPPPKSAKTSTRKDT